MWSAFCVKSIFECPLELGCKPDLAELVFGNKTQTNTEVTSAWDSFHCYVDPDTGSAMKKNGSRSWSLTFLLNLRRAFKLVFIFFS